jgi:hypothetical protein
MFPIIEENKTDNVVQPNIEARSCNHGYSGTSISITYPERVFVALMYPAFNGHSPYCHL